MPRSFPALARCWRIGACVHCLPARRTGRSSWPAAGASGLVCIASRRGALGVSCFGPLLAHRGLCALPPGAAHGRSCFGPLLAHRGLCALPPGAAHRAFLLGVPRPGAVAPGDSGRGSRRARREHRVWGKWRLTASEGNHNAGTSAANASEAPVAPGKPGGSIRPEVNHVTRQIGLKSSQSRQVSVASMTGSGRARCPPSRDGRRHQVRARSSATAIAALRPLTADHAAAGMRRGAAEVEAGDGGARPRSAGPTSGRAGTRPGRCGRR